MDKFKNKIKYDPQTVFSEFSYPKKIKDDKGDYFNDQSEKKDQNGNDISKLEGLKTSRYIFQQPTINFKESYMEKKKQVFK